jgi:Flp pilus assembly protein TadD
VIARPAISALALLVILAPGCAREDPEAVWTEARRAFEARQFGRAEALMERVGKLREATPEDHTLRAQLLMARDKNEEALAELKAVPDSHRLASQARLQSGQLELRRNRARLAEGYFREAIRLDPKLAAAHRELIYILGYELRRAELNAEFRALSECEPLRYDQAFLWCLSRGLVWEPAEAAEKLELFVAADPDDRQARLARAEMHRRLARYADVEQGLAPLGDDDPEARSIRVELALDKGDESKAESLLAGGPRVHLGLALLRGRMAIARGEDKAAVAAFRDALAAEPNNRDAIFGLAHALQRVGDPEAKRYLDLSARHERLGTLVQRAANPGSEKNVALIHDLGAACADAGRLPEARAWYTIAITKDPFDTVAQQALYRLNNEGKPPAS